MKTVRKEKPSCGPLSSSFLRAKKQRVLPAQFAKRCSKANSWKMKKIGCGETQFGSKTRYVTFLIHFEMRLTVLSSYTTQPATPKCQLRLPSPPSSEGRSLVILSRVVLEHQNEKVLRAQGPVHRPKRRHLSLVWVLRRALRGKLRTRPMSRVIRH